MTQLSDSDINGEGQSRAAALVVPTITAAARSEFEHYRDLYAGRADAIHIDYSDGAFAPNCSLPLDEMDVSGVALLPSETRKSAPNKSAIHLHLMANDPEAVIDDALNLHPRLTYIHAECRLSIEAIVEFSAKVRAGDSGLGLALLPQTPANDPRVKRIIESCGVVSLLVFAGRLGYQGGTADLSQLRKIQDLKLAYPGVSIAWDGGANSSNISQIAASGVSIINVGSAIAQAVDPLIELELLQELALEDSGERPLCNNCD